MCISHAFSRWEASHSFFYKRLNVNTMGGKSIDTDSAGVMACFVLLGILWLAVMIFFIYVV